MRARLAIALLLVLLACNDTALVDHPIPTVEYSVTDGELSCPTADATYERDVNVDGVMDPSCWWDCAYSTDYGIVGSFEAHYFISAHVTGLSYYAGCSTQHP